MESIALPCHQNRTTALCDGCEIPTSRLKLRDQRAKDQKQLHDLDVRLKEATIANLEAQRRGEPAPLTQIAGISSQKHQLRVGEAPHHVPPADESTGRPQRPRRPPFRFRRIFSILVSHSYCWTWMQGIL